MTGSVLLTRRLTAAAAAVMLSFPVLAPAAAAVPDASSVTPQVAAALVAATVNEKLAHDVDVSLSGRYDLPIFGNVATSEGRHLDAMRALLAKHGIADPTVGDAAGRFDDAATQQLHDELVARGAVSLIGALETGARTERLLIDGLNRAAGLDLPRSGDNVVANLLEGSRSHLAAFEGALAQAVAAAPTLDATRIMQMARVHAPRSGRYQAGATLVLARSPVRTDAGVTVRWRATVKSRATCRVETRAGRATVTLLKPGTCRVIGYAPAPSPDVNAFRVQRTYRAIE